MKNQQWTQKIGRVAYNRYGKTLMKSAALMREANGEILHWRDKPGWRDGKLENADVYDEWLRKVRF